MKNKKDEVYRACQLIGTPKIFGQEFFRHIVFFSYTTVREKIPAEGVDYMFIDDLAIGKRAEKLVAAALAYCYGRKWQRHLSTH